ncbi:hypothetical protein VNO80_10279 [Phaseolus coccineus]|uniref:Uncharacterized protein n=1 Tax=Phaseolus coccineus TaxID=3886 RepID=A0AAN9RAB7_PHACN
MHRLPSWCREPTARCVTGDVNLTLEINLLRRRPQPQSRGHHEAATTPPTHALLLPPLNTATSSDNMLDTQKRNYLAALVRQKKTVVEGPPAEDRKRKAIVEVAISGDEETYSGRFRGTYAQNVEAPNAQW